MFIDESGDPGFKLTRGSSPAFVVALVAFSNIGESLRVRDAMNAVAAKHGVRTEFKFSKSRPAIKDALFEAVASYDFCVRAIVVRKERIYSAHLRSDREGFYSFFVKTMLKFDNGLLKGAKVIIDGSGGAPL